MIGYFVALFEQYAANISVWLWVIDERLYRVD